MKHLRLVFSFLVQSHLGNRFPYVFAQTTLHQKLSANRLIPRKGIFIIADIFPGKRHDSGQNLLPRNNYSFRGRSCQNISAALSGSADHKLHRRIIFRHRIVSFFSKEKLQLPVINLSFFLLLSAGKQIKLIGQLLLRLKAHCEQLLFRIHLVFQPIHIRECEFHRCPKRSTPMADSGSEQSPVPGKRNNFNLYPLLRKLFYPTFIFRTFRTPKKFFLSGFGRILLTKYFYLIPFCRGQPRPGKPKAFLFIHPHLYF